MSGRDRHADRGVRRGLRAALYARVSTPGQDPLDQLRELRQYAAARGFKIAEEFVDVVSGAKERRPALDRLMKAAHRRSVDVVLVWRIDRLGRSLRHVITCLDTFRSIGVELSSLHDQIDTTTPSGKVVFAVIAAVAEFEREIIRERIQAGLARARSQGKRLGRPPRSVALAEAQGLRAKGWSL